MTLSVDPGTVSLQVGKSPQAMTIKVSNTTGNPAGPGVVTVTVPLTNLGVTVANKPGECTGQGTQYACSIPALGPDASWAGVFQFGPPVQSNLQPGDRKSDNGLVQLSTGERQSYTIELSGPSQDPVVPSVSGIVRDGSNGRALSQATVALRDAADHMYQTSSDSTGHFIFRSTTGKTITPGTLSIGAARDGFQNKVTSIEASAGQNVTGVVLALQATAPPTKSAAASAVPSAPGAINVGPSVVAEDTQAQQEGTKPASDGFPWMPVILGLLLVLLGGGGIAYLFYRRKDDGEDDDQYGAAAAAAGAGPRGQRPGGYRPANAADETRVVPAYGAPTMVGARGTEASTMLTPRSSLDEFADPYGAPPVVPRPPTYGNPPGYDDAPTTAAAPGFRPDGGYGAARPTSGGGYGARPTSGGAYGPTSGAGYGARPTSGGRGYGDQGRPTSGAGYGGAGYGETPRRGGYAEQGNGYGPTSGAGYGGATSGAGYGSSSGAGYGGGGRRGEAPYGSTGGYSPTSGAGHGSGYGDAPRHGGYGDQGHRGDAGGYPARGADRYDGGNRHDGGYEAGGRGYEPRGDDTRGYDPRGYDQDAGYETGRTRRAERRSVDWLDD